jgi:hypothetical protein
MLRILGNHSRWTLIIFGIASTISCDRYVCQQYIA